MTPSPYQAASTHSSQTPSASDRDARRTTMDWPEETAAPAAGGPVMGANVARVVGERIAGSADSSPPSGGAQDESAAPPLNEAAAKLALELNLFTEVASQLRRDLVPAKSFKQRCQQAFDIANDLFGNAPTWVCFYRELMAAGGMLHTLFSDSSDYAEFQGSDQYQQLQGMLTALRSRDLPESDPNDPQRMITVRLPKSLHEAMCDEATRLNISVNKLCISRMLQTLDPAMIPETNSKPRGRKPRARSKETPSAQAAAALGSGSQSAGTPQQPGAGHAAGDGNPRGFDFTSHIRRP